MTNNIRKEDGTGMTPAPVTTASGAVTSQEVGRKNPKQGIKPRMKIDTNSHGVRRETSTEPKPARKVGRKKI